MIVLGTLAMLRVWESISDWAAAAQSETGFAPFERLGYWATIGEAGVVGKWAGLPGGRRLGLVSRGGTYKAKVNFLIVPR